MRIIYWVAICICFTIISCSDDTTSPDDDTTNTLAEPSTTEQIVPLKVGNSWTYLVTFTAPDGTLREPTELIEEIRWKQVLPASSFVLQGEVFEQISYGDVWFYAFNDLDGYAAVDTAIFQTAKSNGRLEFYQTLPHSPPPGFQESFRVSGEPDAAYVWEIDRVDITTQAGEFRNCWRVRVDETKYQYWFRGVGMVYWVDSTADGTVRGRKELKAFDLQ